MKEYTEQTEFEFVSIEQQVPQDHLLRLIAENFDGSFVRQRMEPLYSQTAGWSKHYLHVFHWVLPPTVEQKPACL